MSNGGAALAETLTTITSISISGSGGFINKDITVTMFTTVIAAASSASHDGKSQS